MDDVNSAWLLFDRPPSPARLSRRAPRCAEMPASVSRWRVPHPPGRRDSCPAPHPFPYPHAHRPSPGGSFACRQPWIGSCPTPPFHPAQSSSPAPPPESATGPPGSSPSAAPPCCCTAVPPKTPRRRRHRDRHPRHDTCIRSARQTVASVRRAAW